MNLKAVITAVAAAAIGVGLAGCGGSSKAPGVALAPEQGSTVENVTATATTPTTTTPTTTVTTPTSGTLSKEPVIVIPKGAAPRTLIIRDVVKGTGPVAKKGSTVWVNYVGKLFSTGKIFDASWKDTPGKAFGPITIGAGQVIKGWDQGLVGMRVGGRRELIIPPTLAYGASGSPPAIPKNATLVFVVDLLAVH
jgi:peptidylprolyl isomerase